MTQAAPASSADLSRPDDELLADLTTSLRESNRATARELAKELALRRPDDLDIHWQTAELEEEFGDYPAAARRWKRLRDEPVVPPRLRAHFAASYVKCLVGSGALSQAESEIVSLEGAAADRTQATSQVAELWWLLRQDLLAADESERALQAGVRSVDALLKLRDVTPAEELEATLGAAWQRTVALTRDTAAERPQRERTDLEALKSASRNDREVEVRDLAALLISPLEPAWVLALEPSTPVTPRMIQARAVARLLREQPVQAAQEFDKLEQVVGPLGRLPVRRLLRLIWVQTAVASGRLLQAETACQQAIEELGRETSRLLAEAEAEADGLEVLERDLRWLRQLLAQYSVELGRTALRQGHYTDAWDTFSHVQEIDVGGHRQLGGVLAHLKMLMAPTAEEGARHLEEIWNATDWRAGEAGILRDTHAIEASLWLASRWEDPEGGWDHACEGTGPEARRVRESLAVVRSRGLAMVRENLSRAGKEDGATDVEARLRLALLAGDELLAKNLVNQWTGDERDSWAGRVLRAVCHLQSGQEQDRAALVLMREVMAERRFDLDLRVLYAHTALLAGEIQEGAQECVEILEMAPEHVLARVVRAECAFEMALPTEDAKAAAKSSGMEAAAMENVHQLIIAVRDYREALVLDARTKRFYQDTAVRPGGPLGSDVLTPRQVVQACRRGLHAAILAQEGIDRLGLTRDAALEQNARALVLFMRQATDSNCPDCDTEQGSDATGLRGWVTRRWHEVRHHSFDRDEVARLTGLLRGYRQPRWLRFLQGSLWVVVGLVALGFSTLPGPWSDLPPVQQGAVTATLVAFGLALIIVPFVRSVRLGGFELQRPDRAPPLSGRSKALRSSSVLQRNALLSTSAANLPAAPPAAPPSVAPERTSRDNAAVDGRERLVPKAEPMPSAQEGLDASGIGIGV